MRWPGRRRRRLRRIFNDPEVVAVFRLTVRVGAAEVGALVAMKDEMVRVYGDDLMFQLVEGFVTFRMPSRPEGE